MLALIVGSGLAVLGLLFVLMPLLRGSSLTAPATPAGRNDDASAIEALREIEFDQATGKLSPEDYATLRADYAPKALAELEARDAGAARTEATDAAAREIGAVAPGGATDQADPAESLIARMKSRARSCAQCGPRSEDDAVYCSDCGRYLSPSCLRCGAEIEDPHSRFCGECGSSLAA